MTPEDELHDVIVGQITGNIPGLPHERAHAIAADIASAMDVSQLRVRAYGAHRKVPAPADGTICRGDCGRGVYSKATRKAELPENGVHHHARGYCGTCNSRKIRASRKARGM